MGLLSSEHQEVDFCCCFLEKPGIKPLVYKVSDLTTAPQRSRKLWDDATETL